MRLTARRTARRRTETQRTASDVNDPSIWHRLGETCRNTNRWANSRRCVELWHSFPAISMVRSTSRLLRKLHHVQSASVDSIYRLFNSIHWREFLTVCCRQQNALSLSKFNKTHTLAAIQYKSATSIHRTNAQQSTSLRDPGKIWKN